MSTNTIMLYLRSLTKDRLVRYLRYLTTIVLVAALCVGLYLYLGFIKTPPACALENHHGTGNCPVQVLR